MDNNSISPTVWGPSGWAFIHYVALGYPNNPSMKDNNDYKNYYYNLAHVIPCEKCKEHYKETIIDNPPKTQNKDELFKWTVDIHNIVNKRLNKPTLTYTDALHIWKNKNIEINIENPLHSNTLYLLVAIIIILIIIFICKSI